MIPGNNLLRMALQVIAPTQGVAFQQYLGEQENDFGGTAVSYGPTTPLFNVSVQPVTKSQIQQMGLAVNKSYITVWCDSQIEGSYRGRQNDIILWDGAKWEVQPESDWIKQDGWEQILAVKL